MEEVSDHHGFLTFKHAVPADPQGRETARGIRQRAAEMSALRQSDKIAPPSSVCSITLVLMLASLLLSSDIALVDVQCPVADALIEVRLLAESCAISLGTAKIQNGIITNREVFYSFLDGFSEEHPDTIVVDVTGELFIEQKLMGE